MLVLRQELTDGPVPSDGWPAKLSACLLHGFLLFVWTIAFLQWLNEALSLNMALLPLMAACGIFCALLEISVWITFLWQMAGGTVILLMLYIWQERDLMVRGINEIACQIANVISQYYHIELQTGYHFAGSGEIVPVMIVLAAILILVMGITTVKWHIGTIPGILSVLILAASLAVDCFPSVVTVGLLFIAGAGLCVLALSGEQIFGSGSLSRTGVKSSLYAVCMMVILLLSSYLCAEYYVAEKMHGYYDRISEYPRQMIQAVEQIISGQNGEGSPLEKLQNLMAVNFLDDSGKLTNQAPVQTGTVALEMDTDKKPEEAVYIKNYIGTVYNTKDEQWESVSDRRMEDIYGTWQSSSQWSYDEAKQILAKQLYRCLDLLSETPECVYEITDKTFYQKCTWVPYGVDTDGLMPDGDRIFKPSAQFHFDGYQMSDSRELMENFESGMVDPEAEQLIDDYTAYVYDTCLDVPEGMNALAKRYRQLYDIYGDMDDSQWLTVIQEDLAQNCKYEKYDLEEVSSESNLIDDFYGRQKKGYCIHFASAGVMLLRMAGIPARYVTGYVAWPEDFSYDNEKNQYHADITGYRGHAWIEVYDADSGVWLPVDMTPAGGARNQMEDHQERTKDTVMDTEETDTEPDSRDQTDEMQETSGDDGGETVSDAKTQSHGSITNNDSPDGAYENGNHQDNRENAGEVVSDSDNHLPVMIAAAIALLFLMVICYVHHRWNRDKKQRFSRINRNKALLSMEWHLAEVMEKAGWKPEKSCSDWEYAAWVQEKVDTLEEGEYLYFMEKLHQAAYSEELLTEEEYEKCCTIYKKILNQIRERKSGHSGHIHSD